MSLPMSKSECLKHGIKWTASKERQYNAALIKEKRKLFKELCIPFPAEIETKFYAAIDSGKKDVETYLDNLCQSKIIYAYDNYTKVIYEHLCANCKDEILSEKDIKIIVGKYGLSELKKANLLDPCNKSKTNRLYRIKEFTQ